jgi:acetyl-CoA carboxylase biotin carboxyl carrier protein
MTKKTSHESDVSFIQALAELLRENDLTELQVKRNYGENDSLNVRVSRQTQVVMQAATVAAAPVTSPMVGTVYMAGEPGAAAFVSVGTVVKEGDTLLIIEAMKTMNHIPAPRAGTVKRILVEDGGPVEYGAPLVILE